MARSKRLPLTAAYQFAEEHGLAEEAKKIKDIDTSHLTKPSMPRRGYFVDLFREHGLLADFIQEHWPDGDSPSGAAKMDRYADYKSSFEQGEADDSTISPAQADRLVDLIRKMYPDWEKFDDPRFEEDEIHYKQDVVEAAAEQLSEEVLEGLIDAGEYDAVIERIDAIGKQTNLLFLRIPGSSDLNLLYREGLPKESFCRAVLDLVHGQGDGPDRLDRYLGWIAEQEIPRSHNKWTLPTYLLFFCHPEEEMFVKPSIVRKFFNLIGQDIKLGDPAAGTYRLIRDTYDELGDLLDDYSPRDMVDLQSFVWVAVRAHEKADSESGPIAEARRAFSEERETSSFQCHLRSRYYRAPQIQELLADADSLSVDVFNKEIWRRISSVELDGRDVTDLFNRKIDDSEAKLLLDAMEEGTLRIHGNNIWGSGSHVYGSMLRLRPDKGSRLERIITLLDEAGGELSQSDLLSRVTEANGGEALAESELEQLIADNAPYLVSEDGRVRHVSDDQVKARYIREAARILHDSGLDPSQKAQNLMNVPGFGRNTATGLVMVFHPEEYGLYNQLSRGVLERLDLPARDLDQFHESLTTLREELGAEDHLELDLFLTRLDENIGLLIQPAPSYWWVNQGTTYEEEKELGCVWAPTPQESGKKLRHHMAVNELEPGDRLLHYHDGMIRAVGKVVDEPRERSKESSDTEGPIGFYAGVEYTGLESPIDPAEISEDVRRSEQGPFDRLGGIKQGYLFPLTDSFVEHLRGKFENLARLLPATEEDAWLFQANPKLYDLSEALKTKQAGSEGEWYVSRYADAMHEGDPVYLWQSGNRAGLYATGRITGRVFESPPSDWMEEGTGPVDRVPFVYERILDRPIPRDEIMGDSALSRMQIITAPQGTNFKVTAEEHRRLQEILDGGDPIEFDEILARVDRAGMRISEDVLRRYHLALQTRGFVILAGLSGSGKTWLTQLYAEATGARSKLIPVAPNWTTNEDLLGYFNPITQEYHDTPFSRFLRDAAAEYERASDAGQTPTAFHVTLDEMNLARIEYYFARFLSAMEIRARQGTATIELGPEDTVTLPPNLYFVGTVNIDETTHGFADKVYDRAQLIELEAPRPLLVEHLGDLRYAGTLMDIWDAVAEVAPFAFRVLDEIEVYVTAAEEYGVKWQDALDEQVVQKVLPKLKGGDPRIGQALEAVMHVAEGTLPLTHAKASKMAEALRDYGFTSYF